MTEFEFTQKIRFAVPQAKDIQRAEKIKGMAGYQTRMTAANKQIKAITDHEKFFRRVHAFIFNGIDCDLSGSPIFGHMATQYAKNYVKTEVKVATDRENFRKLLDSIQLTRAPRNSILGLNKEVKYGN